MQRAPANAHGNVPTPSSHTRFWAKQDLRVGARPEGRARDVPRDNTAGEARRCRGVRPCNGFHGAVRNQLVWLLARDQHPWLVPGQEPTTMVGSWPGTNNNGWFLARDQKPWVIPGQEPTHVGGSWSGTNNHGWFLARDQQRWLVPGQEPTTMIGSWSGNNSNGRRFSNLHWQRLPCHSPINKCNKNTIFGAGWGRARPSPKIVPRVGGPPPRGWEGALPLQINTGIFCPI